LKEKESFGDITQCTAAIGYLEFGTKKQKA
jgi:hypothetical protein